MKRIISLLLLIFSFAQSYAQLDTLTPEKKARYRIGRLRDNTIRAITPSDFRNAFNAVTDMSANRVPFVTMAQLRAGKADTARVVQINEGRRSGSFVLDINDTTTPDDGSMVLVVNGKRYKREYSGPIDVKWFGAKGDWDYATQTGTDDTDAIQAALNFAGYGGWGLSINSSYKRVGGRNVYLSPTKNAYRITKTLYIPAYVTLMGDTQGGFWYSVDTQLKYKSTSTLICDFVNPLSWAIESDVYLANAIKPTYDQFYNGNASDTGIISQATGITVQNVSLIVKTGTELLGGIKMMAATQCKILHCYVRGTNIGYAFSASWGSEINSRSETKKCGVFLGSDVHGTTLDGYYDRLTGTTPMPEANALFNFDWAEGGLTDLSDKTMGVAIKWTNGIGSKSLVLEHWNYGLVNVKGDITVNSLYLEGNTVAGVTGYACNVNVGNISAYNNPLTISGGIGFWGTMDSHSVTPFTASFNAANTRFTVNKTSVSQYIKGLEYIGDKNVIYVKSTGSDSFHGYSTNFPVKSLTAAFQRITDNPDYLNSAANRPKGGNYTIVLLDAVSTFELTGRPLLTNMNVSVVGTGSTKPTIAIGNATNAGRIDLSDTKIKFQNVNLTKGSVPYGTVNALFWAVVGNVNVTLDSCVVTLIAGSSILYPDVLGTSTISFINNINSITGPVTSSIIQNNSGVPHLVTYIRNKGTLTGGIETQTDFATKDAVNVPDNWITKRLVNQ